MVVDVYEIIFPTASIDLTHIYIFVNTYWGVFIELCGSSHSVGFTSYLQFQSRITCVTVFMFPMEK